MCLIVVLYRVAADAPVIVGANREEAYERGGLPPQKLPDVEAIGGIDPRAGGTWLGLNGHGVLVSVTNRPKSDAPKTPRSRGLLGRDLLRCGSAHHAAEKAVKELQEKSYAGCNLVCLDESSVHVIHAGDWLRWRLLTPGIHVLTSQDVDDASDVRLAHALDWLRGRDLTSAEFCVTALRDLCAQTGNGTPPMCLRGPKGGTVSSSILILRKPLERGLYLHSQGPPDRTPYVSYGGLLAELSASSGAG
jgi:uncharacterized protein with NRDE domain